MPRILSSLIQSDYGGHYGNFEAVIQKDDQLVHYWRDNTKVDLPWNPNEVIVPHGVMGSGSIYQSDFRHADDQGNLHGNFEVVVPWLAPDGTHVELWHYWHDSRDTFTSLTWQRDPGPITGAKKVAGPGCIIQSDFRNDGVHGNFEVVVPLFAPDGTQELWHFWRDSGDRSLIWYPRVRDALSIRANRIATNVAGPGCIIQSDFRKNGGHGNFEVVVPIGSSLIHFFHDNSDMTLPWQRGQTITEVAGAEGHTVEQVAGWGCIMRSNFGAGEHGNFEVLVEEGRKTVVHYWYPNHDIPRPCPNLIVPWMRMAQEQVIVGERDPMHIASTHRVAQLTGEFDVVTGHPTLNKTESRPPYIRGTDLGVSFEHNNQVCFLFGDTWHVNQKPEEQDLDSIAFCSDTEPPVTGLHLTFNSKPPLFRPIYNIDQHAFNVPLDGVSRNGAMYVFFSTCHYVVEGNHVMGRSILGRSDDNGLNFDYIGEFSRRKFINVSIEPDLLDEAAAEITRFAVGTPVLWIWGNGRYRASPIYLAVMPLASIEGLLWPVRYFAGGTPWSSNEEDAVPLFGAGDVGEFSVRWNPYLARWLALFHSGNPRGIVMHSAPRPWGPWSKDPVMIFDPWKQGGYCHFIHRKWDPDPASPTGFVPSTQCDNVQDDVIKDEVLTPGGKRDNVWGGEYGPYQITRFATGKQGESSQIWFTMSTWNPYQVMLMTSTITANMI